MKLGLRDKTVPLSFMAARSRCRLFKKQWMRYKCHHKRQVLVPGSRDMGQRTTDVCLLGENAWSSLHAPSTQRDDGGQTAGYVKEKFISNLFY